MQCYQSQAMRLQLYRDAQAMEPDLAFDELALDTALTEFGIDSFEELFDLRLTTLRLLVERTVEMCAHQAAQAPPVGQYCPDVGGPVSLERTHAECAALHGCRHPAVECALDGWLRLPAEAPARAVSPSA